jgi:leucyl aminopeptidase
MLHLKSGDLGKSKINTWIVPVSEDKKIHDDNTIVKLVQNVTALKEFSGKKEDEVTLYNPDGVTAQRVIFIGVGKFENFNLETFRAMAGKAIKKCMARNISQAMLIVPSEKKTGMEYPLLLEALMEGAFLGNHLFDKYKNDKQRTPLQKIHFFTGSQSSRKFSNLASRVESICQGTILAREWVSMPPNDKRPHIFAQIIKSTAAKEKLKITVMDEKRLKKEKFGGILSVAAGSTSKPRLMMLDYRAPKAKKTIALVGKGVTFDSGGINLKGTGFIEDMKMDMAGAAAVAATLIAVAKLKPAINVVGVIPLVENMPSGGASRPGDIIGTYKGKTVEIGNTDAEGRLILIDALAYAIKTYKPHTIIDAATLTGACAVALGEKIAGVFSFNDDLAKTIVASGEKTHERCWHMPLPEDYKELIKSEFADIHNMSSSRYGGAITAALFLSEFVDDANWAHIDIAGPAYVKKSMEYCNPGGTGFGVRLLCDLLDRL